MIRYGAGYLVLESPQIRQFPGGELAQRKLRPLRNSVKRSTSRSGSVLRFPLNPPKTRLRAVSSHNLWTLSE